MLLASIPRKGAKFTPAGASPVMVAASWVAEPQDRSCRFYKLLAGQPDRFKKILWIFR
jgi:hypothetical protein